MIWAFVILCGVGCAGSLTGDAPEHSPSILLQSGILEVPDSVYEPAVHRYLINGIGGPGIAVLHPGQAAGYGMMRDFEVDLHDEGGAPAITSHPDTGYTGKGVTIAIIDTGVDFSNPDISHSLARDHQNIPIMLDADGQGLVITNATFVSNVNEFGVMRNSTEKHGYASSVYVSKEGGVFLDVEQGGEGTELVVYNSLFPNSGEGPTFNGTLDDDMRIGQNPRDYIESKSGVYRLGVIYQGITTGPNAGLQTIPVLVVDSEEEGVYDTIIPDLTTGWKDYAGERGYDFDFTDERPIKIGGGQEFIVYDSDGDGRADFSAGTAGARVLDIYGVTGAESLVDDYIGAINGTLLLPMDPGGQYFGIMTDLIGHGTASASVIASNGTQEYDVYGNSTKYALPGVAPGASIIPIKALWFGDAVYASLWAAGFDSAKMWEYSGRPRADIISNSWGVSSFPLAGQAPGMDTLSLIQNAIATPHSLERRYPGTLIFNSAGNAGHGYGTAGFPAAASLGISVAASTDNVFVGYEQFADQPRFGNGTSHSGHIADFSGRGPSIIGDPKPDVVATGAYGFAPSSIMRDPDSTDEPFSIYGGTSMAAPLAAGSASLVIEALNERNIQYDPFYVKSIIMSSAHDMHNDALVQGAGMVDAGAAVDTVLGKEGRFIIYNDATYQNVRDTLDVAYNDMNSTRLGLERLLLPDIEFEQPSWFAGKILPGGRSGTLFTIENPTDEPLEVTITAERLEPIHSTSYEGVTIPRQQEDEGEDESYTPNYIRLGDVRDYPDLASYYKEPEEIPKDTTLLVLHVRYAFDEFMNSTSERFADDMRIASLYLYDWLGNGTVSSSDTVLVSRAGAWGTVQEMRVSDPLSIFDGTPLVGVYPVPQRFSYWHSEPQDDSDPMEYELSATYYAREQWDVLWLDRHTVTVPPGGQETVRATIAVPAHYTTGVYQGFVRFAGVNQTTDIPVTFGVRQGAGSGVLVPADSDSGILYGNGNIRGAFDMANRYMAGDWRHYYFDVEDESVNAGIFDVSWEDPDTHLSLFAIDPAGSIISSSVPPGVFAEFQSWPSSDWLGISPFSEGGGFYHVDSKTPTSSGMYVPINQTGTYSIMAHSGLYGANQTTEGVSVSARFTSVLQP